ncbi:MAG TPA: helix-turn-helix domain-containing protein [Nocardioidaceae bacterium]|nr:helix-turn-helix domain-containing protein [Nocardioidaceae bacterium]
MSTSVFDPALVLGCTEEEALALLHGRRVTPGEVESVAVTSYQWWRHLRDPGSYWVTTSQAARLLHVPAGAVRRMLDDGRLSCVVHSSGVRLMRRHEVEELAQRRGRGMAAEEPRPAASSPGPVTPAG